MYAYSQGHAEQKPMKNIEENSHGRSQGVPKILTSGHPYMGGGALRGHLCNSTAFLFTQLIITKLCTDICDRVSHQVNVLEF